jgi:ATP-dependent RNA helicase DDX5/DBP2
MGKTLTLLSSHHGASNGYSNSNGYAGAGGYGGSGYGGGSYGGGGDKMSNLGANLQKQHWGGYQ